MNLEIPPPPGNDPTPAQALTAAFGGYGTHDLIELFRRMRPGDDVDEERAVEEAHSRGEASHLEVLAALQSRESLEVYEAIESLCRHDSAEEKVLGLMILREFGPPRRRPLFDQTWSLLESMLEDETDVDVLYWVLACLRATYSPRVIDTLGRFSTHPDDDIRRGIAFGIAGCGSEDPRVVEIQLRLAQDPDLQVRGHALYDFVNEIQADTPEIREVLTRLLEDPDPGIRLDAKAALRVRDYR